MKKFLFLFLIISLQGYGQKLKKADRAIIKDLETTVTFLANDELEGRRTGTKGEKMAYEYLQKRLEQLHLTPIGDNSTFLQTFQIDEGKVIDSATTFTVNGKKLKLHEDFYPLAFCPEAAISATVSPSIKEQDVPWFIDVKDLTGGQENNPHFDILNAVKKKADEVYRKGASALIIVNSTNDENLSFDKKSKEEPLHIPVIVVNKAAENKFFAEKILDYDVEISTKIREQHREGTNVIGFLDNQAPQTIVIGAHYDHLGYGEDHNSLWTGTPSIHNGADDNASGVAAVLELAKMLKNSKLKNNNYLFIFFSGEELGLYGSKYFTQHPTVPLNTINYMINLDMVGRLDKDTKKMTVGGFGTSPTWGDIIPAETKTIRASFDSSGIGPSDHTSFYLKEVPVLFFFTGTHSDYHKPSDDYDKINYTGQLFVIKYIFDIIEKTDKLEKLTFTKTREPQMSGTKFTVSLGIMPDYTYSEVGVHVDGIIDGKAADKAGMKTGDVVLKIGEYETRNLEDYMKALSHFKKGDATKVTVKRGDEQIVFDILF